MEFFGLNDLARINRFCQLVMKSVNLNEQALQIGKIRIPAAHLILAKLTPSKIFARKFHIDNHKVRWLTSSQRKNTFSRVNELDCGCCARANTPTRAGFDGGCAQFIPHGIGLYLSNVST